MKPLFDLGYVVATGCAALALARAATQPEELLERHGSGNFGEVDEAQRQTNLEAIESGGQVRSIFTLRTSERLHVITKIRSSTSIVCEGEE